MTNISVDEESLTLTVQTSKILPTLQITSNQSGGKDDVKRTTNDGRLTYPYKDDCIWVCAVRSYVGDTVRSQVSVFTIGSFTGW
jgi:hypothetical protein